MNTTLRQFSPVARTYAEALLRAARRKGTLDRVEADAAALVEALRRTPRLGVFLDNPQVPTEDKLELLRKALGDRISPLIATLLEMFVRRDRIRHLVPALEHFAERVEAERGVGRAIVVSAHPVADADRERLQQAFERYTRFKLIIDWQVDPEIIGGIVFRFRDLLIDDSLRSELDKLRSRMLATQVLSPRDMAA